jgi:hypothetical protein
MMVMVMMRLGLTGSARLSGGRRRPVGIAAGTGLQLRHQCLQVGCQLLFGIGTGRRPGCASGSGSGSGAALCLDQERLDVRGQLLERAGAPYG